MMAFSLKRFLEGLFLSGMIFYEQTLLTREAKRKTGEKKLSGFLFTFHEDVGGE